MVRGAHVPQRQVTLRRKDEGQQPYLESHIAVDEAHSDEDGNHRHRDGADQLKGKRGQESHTKGFHGAFRVAGPDVLQCPRLGAGTAEPDECGEATGQLEQVVREPVQGRSCLGGPVLCVPADEHHEHRNQRNGHHDDDGAHPVSEQDARTHQ